jgi:iron complex transport system ATP-binding protein
MTTAPFLELNQLILDIPHRNSGDPLNFQVKPGECWGILGPNGVGKTTLLLTLAGLLNPRQGKLALKGQPLHQWPARRRAQQLAFLFQQQQDAFPASVLETTLTSRHPHLKVWQREKPQDWVLARQSLARLDLESLEKRCITTLSGGERQRLALACLLAQQAPLWLLDEPTNHLDLHHQVSALELIREHVEAGGSSLLAMHDLNLTSRFCTHLLLLYPDGSACWGEKNQMLVLSALEKLYQQPLTRIEHQGDLLFFPQVQKQPH